MDISDEQIFESRMINACIMGYLEVVNEYLESHNINDCLYTGWTPLLYAASGAQVEIIDILIKNGADVNKHNDGYTPLMILCNCSQNTMENRITCLTLLIKAGADANASNKQKQTPLMLACMSQEPEFVTELMKHIKNINAFDNRKQTAMMYAVIANKPEIVQLLIENAADVTLTDNNDLTAKDIASMKGYDKILSLFNCDEEEDMHIYEIAKNYYWMDMFPSLNNINNETIDFDIYTILQGMCLEKYSHIFQGINLKTFLTLTEHDLSLLGIEINAHRIQFIENLHKFHRKKWSIQSIGGINKSLPYTLYDGIISLGTVAKQIAIIGTSFQYIKNDILKANNNNVYLTKEQMSGYEEELKRTQKTLHMLKKELIRMKTLSKNIQKENNIGVPATHISPKKRGINWSIFLSVTLIVGICFSKTMCIQRLMT
ncbi:uncharacterized protein LOC100882601 [Megachile rotundata]|uniref:uncharacterized protein LOC100882601 n=1 Tax=Megachile rotundata TaxID=143995 RepID=UPI000614C140|nr:PREDICTED: ankyrin repeat, SAM and basic leucine zipper domain-containing protein 1 [Megachile rotundata]